MNNDPSTHPIWLGDLVQAYQLLVTEDLNKLDLRFAEKISGEDDWDEVKSALNKLPSSLRAVVEF